MYFDDLCSRLHRWLVEGLAGDPAAALDAPPAIAAALDTIVLRQGTTARGPSGSSGLSAPVASSTPQADPEASLRRQADGVAAKRFIRNSIKSVASGNVSSLLRSRLLADKRWADTSGCTAEGIVNALVGNSSLSSMPASERTTRKLDLTVGTKSGEQALPSDHPARLVAVTSAATLASLLHNGGQLFVDASSGRVDEAISMAFLKFVFPGLGLHQLQWLVMSAGVTTSATKFLHGDVKKTNVLEVLLYVGGQVDCCALGRSAPQLALRDGTPFLAFDGVTQKALSAAWDFAIGCWTGVFDVMSSFLKHRRSLLCLALIPDAPAQALLGSSANPSGLASFCRQVVDVLSKVPASLVNGGARFSLNNGIEGTLGAAQERMLKALEDLRAGLPASIKDDQSGLNRLIPDSAMVAFLRCLDSGDRLSQVPLPVKVQGASSAWGSLPPPQRSKSPEAWEAGSDSEMEVYGGAAYSSSRSRKGEGARRDKYRGRLSFSSEWNSEDEGRVERSRDKDLGYDSPEPCGALSPMSVNRLGESALSEDPWVDIMKDGREDLRHSLSYATAEDVVGFHTHGTPLTFHDCAGRTYRFTYHQLLDQSLDFMEECHDFIQPLFPLPKKSGVSPDLPVLSIQQIQELPHDSILRAADVMESFFAYQHEMGNLHGHNILRITRIIKCLALCGLSREARDFRDFAVGLAGTSTVSSEHWDPVINELADELDSDQEDESDSDQELESDSGRELELVDESDSDQELL